MCLSNLLMSEFEIRKVTPSLYSAGIICCIFTVSSQNSMKIIGEFFHLQRRMKWLEL